LRYPRAVSGEIRIVSFGLAHLHNKTLQPIIGFWRKFFEGRQTEPISISPYAASAASHTCRIMAPVPVISDVSNCPFLILFASSIPLNVTSASNTSAAPSGDPAQSCYSSTCWFGRAFERAIRLRPSIYRTVQRVAEEFGPVCVNILIYQKQQLFDGVAGEGITTSHSLSCIRIQNTSRRCKSVSGSIRNEAPVLIRRTADEIERGSHK
jgi:hypothetical protein